MEISPYDLLGAVPSFRVTSDDVVPGERLDIAQVSGILGAGGEDISPQLSWSGFPEATKSFAVTIYDPDAPTGGGYWHWSVVDLPVSVTTLSRGAGVEDSAQLPEGAFQLVNDAGSKRYLGSAPPAGHGTHRYFIGVHALDVESLGINDTATRADLGSQLFLHTIGRAVIYGTWEIPAEE